MRPENNMLLWIILHQPPEMCQNKEKTTYVFAISGEKLEEFWFFDGSIPSGTSWAMLVERPWMEEAEDSFGSPYDFREVLRSGQLAEDE